MKRKPSYVPARGDAVWITLDPQAGHEQAGRRPALVLSPAAYNGRVGLALFCPITGQVKGYPIRGGPAERVGHLGGSVGRSGKKPRLAGAHRSPDLRDTARACCPGIDETQCLNRGRFPGYDIAFSWRFPQKGMGDVLVAADSHVNRIPAHSAFNQLLGCYALPTFLPTASPSRSAFDAGGHLRGRTFSPVIKRAERLRVM